MGEIQQHYIAKVYNTVFLVWQIGWFSEILLHNYACKFKVCVLMDTSKKSHIPYLLDLCCRGNITGFGNWIRRFCNWIRPVGKGIWQLNLSTWLLNSSLWQLNSSLWHENSSWLNRLQETSHPSLDESILPRRASLEMQGGNWSW